MKFSFLFPGVVVPVREEDDGTESQVQEEEGEIEGGGSYRERKIFREIILLGHLYLFFKIIMIMTRHHSFYFFFFRKMIFGVKLREWPMAGRF